MDDRLTKGCKLNANEACIFAAVLKCTRAGRGWYGNYRDLAAAMPFVISYETARRVVQKLLNLGLIEWRDSKLFALTQNVTEPTQIVTEPTQNVTEPTQNVTEPTQNVLPPNNPPINNNNMNEKQLSSPAQDARTEEMKTEKSLDFMDFWFLFSAPEDMLNRESACRRLWESENFSRVKKTAVIKELIEHQMNGTFTKERNPFFYLNNFPAPLPEFLSGQQQDDCHRSGIPLVQVRYNGKFLICTKETAQLFNLDIIRLW